MIQALTRRVHRLIRRAFEGASGGRRWKGLAGLDNLNAGSSQLRRRDQHFAVDSPWVAQGIHRDLAPGGEQ